jgi:predicted  nucleic acid-binding Zn-ribbon protein
MSPRRRWWQRHEPDHHVEATPRAPTAVAARGEEVEELKNEVAELRQDADELRQRLKEAEVLLSSLADDAEERARTTEAVVTWCEEQETVLAKHRDVVAAMGAATRILQTEGAPDDAGAELSSFDQRSSDEPRAPLRPPPRWHE